MPRPRSMPPSRFLLVTLALAACGGGGGTSGSRSKTVPGNGPDASTPGVSGGLPHIGIMTGTVYQTEEEFRAGEEVERRYPGRVRHVTYPDNFMAEQETVIAQLAALASDPSIRVVVVGTAIPGSIAGVRKLREQRPDMLVGLINAQEDPEIVNRTADLAVQPDQLARGETICAEAKSMGARTLIHYSFPRHMSQDLLARRKDVMEQACRGLGVDFAFVSAPDPMGEGGLPATQQFVLEDVPRELARYGQETAFFSTNCGMQEPLIKAVLRSGGFVPEQCCPSPTHGYPAALGIAVPREKAGDFSYIDAENRRVIREHGRSGHFGTWVAPEGMVAIQAVTALLLASAEGRADHEDAATVRAYLEREAGAKVDIKKYDATSGNQYLFLLAHQVY